MPSLVSVRTLVLILLSANVALAADPQSPDWHHDARQAWAAARTEHRPLLLYFTTEGCVYCRKMQHETLEDAIVADTIRETFVAAQLHAKENRSLVRSLRIRVYPTTVILSPDSGVIDYIPGYVAAEPLLARLRSAAPRETTAENGSTHTR